MNCSWNVYVPTCVFLRRECTLVELILALRLSRLCFTRL
jgi:hypothetical protein